MKNLKSKLLSFFPSRLPIGMTAFDSWAKEVIALTPLPDNLSMRFCLAQAIQSLRSDADRVPKRYFAKHLYRAAAGEIANAQFRLLHDTRKAQLAEEEKKAKEGVDSSGSAQPTVSAAQG